MNTLFRAIFVLVAVSVMISLSNEASAKGFPHKRGQTVHIKTF